MMNFSFAKLASIFVWRLRTSCSVHQFAAANFPPGSDGMAASAASACLRALVAVLLVSGLGRRRNVVRRLARHPESRPPPPATLRTGRNGHYSIWELH